MLLSTTGNNLRLTATSPLKRPIQHQPSVVEIWHPVLLTSRQRHTHLLLDPSLSMRHPFGIRKPYPTSTNWSRSNEEMPASAQVTTDSPAVLLQ
ncbi:hypothetical protein DPMN_007288 [Dreissena polymorpha]|uniref:Uncharacterized protein n=1 Tax=Dreissena polymorpha TaxID=45954 RepID=A0A9D4RY91_DREPO|nr:hypothetical protein DPMN_007288 [Dreissena polymorpha]